MFETANGGRHGALKVAVIITSGATNVDRRLAVRYAVDARNNGIYVVMLAVGTLFDDTVMLRSIVSPPTDRSLFNARYGYELPNYRDRLFMASCDGMRFFKPPLATARAA